MVARHASSGVPAVMADRFRVLKILSIILIVTVTGCRDTEPPPTHFEDMGTAGKPLVPTSSVWKESAIAGGQADWRPFRDPADEPVETVDAEEPSDRRSDSGISPVEAEIRELVDEFNQVVRDGAVEEILEYFIEEQTASLKPIVEAAFTATDLIGKIRVELTTKLPDESERIEDSAETLLGAMTFELHIQSVTVESDTAARATVNRSAAGDAYRFDIVDEDWFIQVLGEKTLAQLAPTLTLAVNTYTETLAALQSGRVAAAEVLHQLEAAAAVIQAAAQVPESTGSADAEETVAPVEDDD